MITKRTTTQNKILWSLFARNGIDDENRKVLALTYSNGRTAKTSELNFEECRSLISFLKGEKIVPANLPSFKNVSNVGEDMASIKKKRSKIFKIATENLRMITTEGKIDFVKFNKFMLNCTYLNKPLKEYTVTELDKLINQFQQVAKNNAISNKPKGDIAPTEF